jgi:hypothetical protein
MIPSSSPIHPDPAPFRAALQALYAELDAAIAALGPVCLLSGRCCRFKEYGHTLFLSSPECALLLSDAPAPARPLDDGETCPWQDARGRCTAREARPLGCRVYHCDPGYEGQAERLTERFIAQLKELVEHYQLPWHYAPLHHHLSAAQAAGTLRSPCEEAEPRCGRPKTDPRTDFGLTLVHTTH